MAKILVAKSAGFCFGVRRAINIAEKAVKSSQVVYSLGPIIHNPQEVKRLESAGLKPIENEFEINPSKIVIRSHGISPQREAYLKNQGFEIVDATCPYVKAVHDAVQELCEDGYFIVLIGEKNHPEVLGTLGYLELSDCKGVVVESKEDLKQVLGKEKVGIVSQTTQSEQFFKEIVGEIALWTREVKVINTICNATSERQEGVIELAPKVDVMVIIGGKNSGNTRRLFEISKSLNPNSFHIETEEELKKEWFENISSIGITAGASTPDWLIERVIARLREL
ncbi:MAG: 4-hydroxy-3-methylbut-2-enyl diphosphate reductase, partial [Aquificaceae bacterium]|nr:4-hydroxy-3-methylbut-2-enyl diphosphate reductase [Aquificaceae bacterium]MDW8237943.1 4-hydroxy-3-methylbut-2-enyl diphosphate reductase [Aquificaceae bacterium]